MVECGVRPQERESGAGGGGGEREVKIRRHTIPRIGRADKENYFRSPLLETESAYTPSPSSAVRQLKVARPQPRSPAPRADPEGQFVYK